MPWIGGQKVISHGMRAFRLTENPTHHGWWKFEVKSTRATPLEELEYSGWDSPPTGAHRWVGYIVGNRIIHDDLMHVSDPEMLWNTGILLNLVPGNLDLFSRAEVFFHGTEYVYFEQQWGSEVDDLVREAFEDRAESISHIKGVSPALETAFRFETWRREKVEERRAKAVEEARRQEARRRMQELMGTGEGRRELARTDFEAAAKAALEVSGAELLSVRKSYTDREFVVRYRFMDRRLECTVDDSLQVVDAGVCLTDERTGEQGDGYFTLESLPAVISEATRINRLVVWRHG